MLLERDELLASLRRLYEQARDGQGRLVFLSGEAGVGKSAVLDAFAALLPPEVVHRSGCDTLLTPELSGFTT